MVTEDQSEAFSKWASRTHQCSALEEQPRGFPDSAAATETDTFAQSSRETSKSEAFVRSDAETMGERVKIPGIGTGLLAATAAALRTVSEGAGDAKVVLPEEASSATPAPCQQPSPVGRQVTELHRSVGRREPTEDDESTELEQQSIPHRREKGLRQPTELDEPHHREPTENDERLEDPGHVCTSDNCSCSLRVNTH